MKHVTIQQALQNVVDKPYLDTDEIIQVPVHELISRTLFDIANRPDASVRGSMTKANKARKMILDRLVGKRRAGTNPAARSAIQMEFIDLTVNELPNTEEEADDETA